MGWIREVISGIIVQGIIGFFVWAAWQTAACNLATIPSIPLAAGLGLWFFWFLMLYTPIFCAVYMARKSTTFFLPMNLQPPVKIATDTKVPTSKE